MFDLPLLSFDIETTPNPVIGRGAMGLEGDDRAVILEMMRRRSEETSGHTEYPVQPWHRVICVCATTLHPDSGQVEMLHLGTPDLWDEASQLRGFYELVEKGAGAHPRGTGGAADRRFRLVSWNGAGFDLPILRYRAMAHAIRARRLNEDRKYDSYLSRFGNLHVDLMDVLCGFGAAPRAGLDAVAKSLNLPSKDFLSRPIHEHLLDGEHETIIEYCKLDTFITLLVYLYWGRHAGWIDDAAFERAMAGAQACAEAQVHAGWRELGWAGS